MKRILAVGCSHGEHIDPIARAGVLEFKRRFNPDTVVHLGDNWDLACLRSGAGGSSMDHDRSHPPEVDVEMGKQFVLDLRPTHFLFGNHEWRATDLARHWESKTALSGKTILRAMTCCLDSVGAQYITEWGIKQFYQFGNFKFLHGTLYGQGFLKKTALSIGNCVVAHAHHPGIVTAERDDGARAYSPGCLRGIDSAGYAKERVATLAWGHGVVWGEYDADGCYLWLHQPSVRETTTGWIHFPV